MKSKSLSDLGHHNLLGKLEKGQAYPEDAELFQEVLGEAMVALDITSQDLADYTGASCSTPRRWLKGMSAPSEETRLEVYKYCISILTTGIKRKKK